MQAATHEPTSDPIGHTTSNTSKRESSETVEVLEELLTHSIHLRDMYKNARWQTADLQFRSLRQLFDGHYNEQIQLVDLLVDPQQVVRPRDRDRVRGEHPRICLCAEG